MEFSFQETNGIHNEDVESCQWRPDRGKCTAEDSAPSLASAPSAGGPVLKSLLIIDLIWQLQKFCHASLALAEESCSEGRQWSRFKY